MKDADTSKEDLLVELHRLRQRLVELKAETAAHGHAQHQLAFMGKMRQKSLWGPLSLIILVTLIGMTAFEGSKQALWPAISIWESHALTILFSTLVAAIGGFFVLRQRFLLYQERITEVDERKQAEEILQTQARILENMAEGVNVSDENATIFFTNPAFEAMFGYERGELIGQHVSVLNAGSPEENVRIVAEIVEQLQAQGVWLGEFRNRKKDGTTFTTRGRISALDLSGETYWVSVQEDITEQQQAERAFRESEEKFFKAFRASPDAITISRLRDGCYLEINDGFERLTGYRREDVLGKTSTELEFWRVEDRERMAEPLRRTGRVSNLKTGFLVKSGVMRDCVISAELIELGGEKCLVAITRDVTERKRAEAEREHLIEELEAKNAELERFTYTVSHDLKSPLVTIKGFLGLLQKDAVQGKTEQMKQDIEQISKAADKMQQLLAELLDLSRIGRLINPPEAVPLTDLAHEAVEQVAGQIGERSVEIEIASEMPVVFGDRIRLLEVLQNLIDNAVKYMGDQSAPRIEVEASREGATVRCTVRDNGMGIAPRFHDKVFGLFERLGAESEGTGIGLALARRIIEVHGGRIWVESEGPGHGATFFFTLPQQDD